MKLKIHTSDASSSTEGDFNIPSFEGKRGLQTLKDVLVAYQANQRQGNASTKTRAAVKGSGKKIYRQKGTGRARHGDRQAPIFIGGGVAHGPHPRDWSKRINKKTKTLALARALYDKVKAGKLQLIEKFDTPAIKTKTLNALLEKIQPQGKILLVDQKFDDNTALSGRNIERLHFAESSSLNAWDLVRFEHTLASQSSFESLLERLQSSKS